jgi:hypothetical protein
LMGAADDAALPAGGAEPAAAAGGTLEAPTVGMDLSAGVAAVPGAAAPSLAVAPGADLGAVAFWPPKSEAWPCSRCQASHRNSRDMEKMTQRIVRCVGMEDMAQCRVIGGDDAVDKAGCLAQAGSVQPATRRHRVAT